MGMDYFQRRVHFLWLDSKITKMVTAMVTYTACFSMLNKLEKSAYSQFSSTHMTFKYCIPGMKIVHGNAITSNKTQHKNRTILSYFSASSNLCRYDFFFQYFPCHVAH